MFDENSLLYKIAVWAIPVLFGIVVHEVAHGWAASKLGDPTAKIQGRITLNPIKHIDLTGTIIVPLMLLHMGGFIFGWAKPVPVIWQNLRHPRSGMTLVALAGPFSNAIMAVIWGLCAKVAYETYEVWHQGIVLFLWQVGHAGIVINLVLMSLNLIPIPPLDGSRIVMSVFSTKLATLLSRYEFIGFFVLVALIALGAVGDFLVPIVKHLHQYIFNFYAIST